MVLLAAGVGDLDAAVLALGADGAVDNKVANARVAGSKDGKANDDTEGDQLSRDLAQTAESLCDGVA